MLNIHSKNEKKHFLKTCRRDFRDIRRCCQKTSGSIRWLVVIDEQRPLSIGTVRNRKKAATPVFENTRKKYSYAPDVMGLLVFKMGFAKDFNYSYPMTVLLFIVNYF